MSEHAIWKYLEDLPGKAAENRESGGKQRMKGGKRGRIRRVENGSGKM